MKYSYNQNYKQIEHPFPQRTRRAFSSCPNPSDFCALAIPSGSANKSPPNYLQGKKNVEQEYTINAITDSQKNIMA